MTDERAPRAGGAALRVVREAVLDALAVVLPVDCAGCGAPDRSVCAECRRALRAAPLARRLRSTGEPSGGPPVELPVVAGAAYDGVLRALLLAAKGEGRAELLTPLAPLLAEAVRTAVARAPGGTPAAGWIELCPVPSSRSGRRRRGFDPVRVLLRRAGCPAPRLLAARRRPRAQKALGAEARAGNVRGGLRATRDLAGRRLLLVDDVVTSGATLLEAARVARAAGAEVVGAVVLAATPRRSGGADAVPIPLAGESEHLPGDIRAGPDYGGPNGAG